jgi:hypothetical protein
MTLSDSLRASKGEFRPDGKRQAPNLQAPENFQTPGTNLVSGRVFEAWNLKVLWMLELGIWRLA